MFTHLSLGSTSYRRTQNLHQLIDVHKTLVAGSKKLKIYGSIHCGSGKRMKIANRVFFLSAGEAEENGYHPCGHCMKVAYINWKRKQALNIPKIFSG